MTRFGCLSITLSRPSLGPRSTSLPSPRALWMQNKAAFRPFSDSYLLSPVRSWSSTHYTMIPRMKMTGLRPLPKVNQVSSISCSAISSHYVLFSAAEYSGAHHDCNRLASVRMEDRGARVITFAGNSGRRPCPGILAYSPYVRLCREWTTPFRHSGDRSSWETRSRRALQVFWQSPRSCKLLLILSRLNCHGCDRILHRALEQIACLRRHSRRTPRTR
jgi:hypothetical protein